MRRLSHIFYYSILAIAFLIFPAYVDAADPKPAVRDSGYAAQYVSQSVVDPIEIEAGSTKTVSVRFKNVGTKTWNSLAQHADGYRHISAYTVEPRYRDSLFAGSRWISKSQTASIAQDVKPGEVAELTLDLQAPEKTGEYVEHFYLAAEEYTWLKGGYFFLKITVVPATSAEPTPQATANSGAPNSEVTTSTTHRATLVARSIRSISRRGGETVPLVLVYRNSGDTTWSTYALVSESAYTDATWVNATTIIDSAETVATNGFVRKEVTLRAPRTRGTYTARLSLNIDGQILPGSETEVTITVTEDAPIVADSVLPVPIASPDPEPRLPEEPRIRVGLATPSTFAQIVSFEDDYRVLDGSTEKGVLPIKKVGIIRYSDGGYSFQGAGIAFETKQTIRLQPVNNPRAAFTVLNLNRGTGLEWVGKSTFNRYRGALEYRKGEVDGQLYVVNDLLLEDYVAGIAETGTGAPSEFVKANLVAARTYAYAGRGKYPFFDVLGSTYDQLYLGADVAELKPDVAAAAQATRGYMVVYNNDIVTTPYFGRSDGRTRSWIDVWGGKAKPWLVSVKTQYDAGKSRRGHGVGMSQTDAALRATKEGSTWQQLLQHYYTGVTLEKIYR